MTEEAVHKQAQLDRKKIADRETAQIKAVEKQLQEHIAENRAQFKTSSEKLDKLAPLSDGDIISTLQRIVKKDEENKIIGQKWAKVIASVSKYAIIIGSVLAILWYALAISLGLKGNIK